MSKSSRTGFFTLGVPPERYQLPHPRLPLPVILLIHKVILRAFEILRSQHFDLASATEDQVTENLRTTIESNLRQTGEVCGFNRRGFETVVRQAQWSNYNHSSPTKTPDLCFKLRDDETGPRPVLPEFEGVFVEAKPVDAKHPVGTNYCDDGLVRFVCGDYAWAMQEGVMLAYVRGRTIAENLIPAMSDAVRRESLKTIQLPQGCPAPGAAACAQAEAVHVSRHERGFPWPDGKGAANEITIYHFWHNCA